MIDMMSSLEARLKIQPLGSNLREKDYQVNFSLNWENGEIELQNKEICVGSCYHCCKVCNCKTLLL